MNNSNDARARGYLKGHLFAAMDDADIIKYLDMPSAPERMPEIVVVFREDSQATELLKEVKTAKENLLRRETEIENILRSIQKEKELE